jgi:hypothetical protein
MLNVKRTCEAAFITRETYYHWYNNSDTFRKAVEAMKEGVYDDIESVIMKKALVEEDKDMVKYLSSTLMKKRGYTTSHQVDQNVKGVVVNKYEALSDEELDAEIADLEKKLDED